MIEINPAPELVLVNYIMPFIIPLLFIILPFSFVSEPYRQRINALILACAGGAYLNGGFGWLEGVFAIVIVTCAYQALGNYRLLAIGWLLHTGLGNYRLLAIGWLLHTGWDILHHLTGNPMILLMPSSSFECAISDTILAVWYFYQAPPVFKTLSAAFKS